eukprot:6050058-Amphidinium_carterae.1
MEQVYSQSATRRDSGGGSNRLRQSAVDQDPSPATVHVKGKPESLKRKVGLLSRPLEQSKIHSLVTLRAVEKDRRKRLLLGRCTFSLCCKREGLIQSSFTHWGLALANTKTAPCRDA